MARRNATRFCRLHPRPRRRIHWYRGECLEVLQDGVLAFLAATGAAALFWLLTGWLRRREPARAVLLVPARGSGDFSGPVAQLLDLRRQLRGLPPIVICDCGLDEEGLSRARELTQRYDNVLLLAPEEIVQNLP